MKNLRQSRMLKAVAVVLLFFSIVSIPVSIIGEAYLAQKVFSSNIEEMFGGEFKDSEIFSGLFSKRIGQLAEYIKLKNILETDGELDYNRIVCSTMEEGTEYTIGELIKRNSFFVEEIDSQEASLLEELFTLYYSQPQSYVYLDETGAPVLDYLYEKEFIRDFSKDTDWIAVEKREEALELFEGYEENTDMEELGEEEQKSVTFSVGLSADEVLVQSVPYENEMPEGAVWVFTPDDLSYRFTYYVAYYLYYQQLFGNIGEQRFIYEVSNGTDTYANVQNIAAYKSGEIGVDGELYYRSSDYTMKTDVENVRRDYVDNLEKSLMNGSEEVTVYAAVAAWGEPEEAAGDIFSAEQSRYLYAQSVCGMLLVIGIAGAFGVLLFGFYLLASAGHAKDVEGVRLTGFDKCYTEIAATVCFVMLASLMGLDISIIADGLNGYYSMGSIIAAGCLTVLSYLAGIFSMATLVRRIKAATLWKNSVLRNGSRWIIRTGRKIWKGCHIIYEERDITARVIIAYIMVLAATVITGILIMISLWSGSIIVLFFLLLFAGIHAGTLYMLLRERMDYKRIIEGVERMADGDLNYKIDEMGLQTDNKRMAVAANRVGDGLAEAVEKSIKDERMKTDLITNVSHDIKTPLTSIINYVDLLKREKIEDEKICSYIDVLDSKSQRLKTLTDDLVEASKLSSGNIILTMQDIDLVELVNQANGEFMEKFALKNLTIIPTLPENPVIIEADGRRLWRVLENLYNNVAKYAMENTRVYVTVVPEADRVSFVMKNISASPLNINADELTERFIRGDVSRSTEGSGLGLSIAQSLTELMKGNFEIYLDGDLFRATVTFPLRAV